MRRRQKGFTLTEILIVLVIITILILIGFPKGLRAILKSQNAANASNLKALDAAAMLCFSDKRSWDTCHAQATLVTDGYLKETINHPCPGSYSFSQDADTLGWYAVSTPAICGPSPS